MLLQKKKLGYIDFKTNNEILIDTPSKHLELSPSGFTCWNV